MGKPRFCQWEGCDELVHGRGRMYCIAHAEKRKHRARSEAIRMIQEQEAYERTRLVKPDDGALAAVQLMLEGERVAIARPRRQGED